MATFAVVVYDNHCFKAYACMHCPHQDQFSHRILELILVRILPHIFIAPLLFWPCPLHRRSIKEKNNWELNFSSHSSSPFHSSPFRTPPPMLNANAQPMLNVQPANAQANAQPMFNVQPANAQANAQPMSSQCPANAQPMLSHSQCSTNANVHPMLSQPMLSQCSANPAQQ